MEGFRYRGEAGVEGRVCRRKRVQKEAGVWTWREIGVEGSRRRKKSARRGVSVEGSKRARGFGMDGVRGIGAGESSVEISNVETGSVETGSVETGSVETGSVETGR